MSLGALVSRAKDLVLVHRVVERLKQEGKMGRLWTALYGLGSFVVTGLVARFTEACPALFTPGGAVAVLTGIGAGLALWAKQRKASTSAAVGLGFAALMAGVYDGVRAELQALCGSDLVSAAPTLAVGGILVGLALWLKSAREQVDGDGSR